MYKKFPRENMLQRQIFSNIFSVGFFSYVLKIIALWKHSISDPIILEDKTPIQDDKLSSLLTFHLVEMTFSVLVLGEI